MKKRWKKLECLYFFIYNSSYYLLQVYNLANLKNEMKTVLDEVDHKNLDKDIIYFKNNVSTTENLIVYLWNELKSRLGNPKLLYKMILHETEKNSVTYRG